MEKRGKEDMRTIRRRGTAVCMAAFLMLSGFTVSAETLQTENADAVENVAMDDIEENLPEVVEVLAEDQIMTLAADDIASGTSGNITWVIDARGKLTVTGSGDLSGNHTSDDFAWSLYSSQITTAEINVTGMTDASWLFDGCENMVSIDVSRFDTSNVISMTGMFYGCSSLTSLDVSNFDTSNVTSMLWMFCDCSSLTSLDVSNFDTSNVTDMIAMFASCSSLTNLDVSNFDTSNVTYMTRMFGACSSLASLDVSSFDTSNVISMLGMFMNSSSLTNLDISSFDTSNVTDMEYMFDGCSSLTTLQSPRNVNTSAELPVVEGTVWNLPDGTEVTELLQGLSYSVTLTRSGTAVTPSDSTTSDSATSGSTTSGNATAAPSRAAESAIIGQIKTAEAGSTVVLDEGITTLSNAVMKELLKKGDVSLKLEFTYNEEEYVIVIPAGAALDNDIPWYGPLYLAQQYGNSAVMETPAAAEEGGVYEVKRGDTLSKIAAANNMTLKQLLAKNPQIKDANRISVGQKINR